MKLSHDAYMEALREAEAKRVAFMGNVGEMRAAGATNQEIGDVLGVTRQRVSQLLQRKDVGKMETRAREQKMEAYAIKFRVDAPDEEPTDEALARVLANCALKPKPEWYDEIRRYL